MIYYILWLFRKWPSFHQWLFNNYPFNVLYNLNSIRCFKVNTFQWHFRSNWPTKPPFQNEFIRQFNFYYSHFTSVYFCEVINIHAFSSKTSLLVKLSYLPMSTLKEFVIDIELIWCDSRGRTKKTERRWATMYDQTADKGDGGRATGKWTWAYSKLTKHDPTLAMRN